MKIIPVNNHISNVFATRNITKSLQTVYNVQNTNYKSSNYGFYYSYPLTFGRAKRTYSTNIHRLAETPSDFKLCRFNSLTCPACGKKMMSRNNFERFAETLANSAPDEYLDVLKDYVHFMRPVEESVYNELCEQAQKPGASKDIRTLLVNLRDYKLPILQKVQMRQIKKMYALAQGLPEDEKNALLKLIYNLKGEIRRKNSLAPFRRKVMIDRISKVKIRNINKYKKLQNIAKNFPTSFDMNSAWIVKYSGKNKMNEDWDSYNIALRLLYSSVANTDHILAYSIENGHDDISNYLAMHNGCNSQKGNKSLMQWFMEDPNNRLKYLQDYFAEADELIKQHKLKKKYNKYVASATSTILEASKGQISINPDENPEQIAT